jgi:hypothetical protein
MVARIQGKLFDEEGLLTFKVTETVEVEAMVDDASKDTAFSTFKKGAVIQGFPAQLVIVKDENGKLTDLGQQQGVLIENENGKFLFPFDFVEEINETVNQQVADVSVSDKPSGTTSLSQLNDKLSNNGILGFSWKQLILITGITAIAVKVFK